MGTPGPLPQPLWTLKGLRATPPTPNPAPLAAPLHPYEEPRHLPRLAWSRAQRSQNWLGSEAQYALSWRLAAYRLLQMPEGTCREESPPRRLHLTLPQGPSLTRKHFQF